MVSNQSGSASNVLLAVVVILVLLVMAYNGSQASPAAVQDVVTKAQTSPAAVKVLKEFLTATPTPTVSQLSDVRSKVEEQLVLERARAVTGDASLQAASTVKAELDKKAREDVLNVLLDSRVRWVLALVLALGVPLLFVKLYRAATR